jgi:3-hydroxybutyryl-CoA dehydratase
MNKAVSVGSLAVGAEIRGPVKHINPERIEWYDSAMLSAAKNELTQVGSNIHTDDDYARDEGFPGVMADGMMMTNWCSTMLIDHFGMDYIERGELRTKFIKPAYLDIMLHVRGKVLAVDKTENGSLYTLDVWCEDEKGTKLVDGHAKVEVRPAG